VILWVVALIPTTQQPVMTVMLVPRQIPALPVLAWAVLPRTATMGMSVQPIVVMPLPDVKTAIILIPVMTVMPVPRQIPVLPESVSVDHRRTVMMAMSVPMTPAIL